MSTTDRPDHNGRGTTTVDEPTHVKDDALDRREFELLVEATYTLDDDYVAFQARFAVLVAGRLGLRAGEIAHMRESWIDWRRNMIQIPRHQACDKARQGDDICGYCSNLVRGKAARNESTSLEQARANMWEPKTDAAAREVPFDANMRATIILERFFERFDRWPVSRLAVNRRVKSAGEEAEEILAEDLYPHCLRASAATHYANCGLDIFALQAMFGWADLTTPMKYVVTSGERTARAIRDSMA